MDEGFIVQYLTWNKKVKKILSILFIIAGLLTLPLIFSLYPSKDSSLEMRAAYYILVVPRWVSDVFLIGISGIITYFILERVYRHRVKGELYFTNDNILFISPRINFDIKIQTLNSIHFVSKSDFRNYLVFTKKDRKKIYFKLLEDVQFDGLFKQILLYDDRIEVKGEPYEFIDMEEEEST